MKGTPGGCVEAKNGTHSLEIAVENGGEVLLCVLYG